MIHILRDGQQFGPYSLEEINAFLADGSLLPSDQAWYEGAPEWIPLTEVPGVALLAQPVSSPVATGVVASGGSGKRKKLLIGIAAGVVVLAGGAFAGMHFLGGEKESEKPGGTSANKEKGVDGSVENASTTGGAMTFSTVEGIFRKYRCMSVIILRRATRWRRIWTFHFQPPRGPLPRRISQEIQLRLRWCWPLPRVPADPCRPMGP